MSEWLIARYTVSSSNVSSSISSAPVPVAPLAAFIALLVVAVGIFDAISTNAGLLVGAIEANPLMAFAQSALGDMWVAPKIGLHLVTALIVLMRPTRAVFACVGTVVAVNAYVVFNNFAIVGVL